MAVQLADRVARLEIGQPQAYEHVRATNDEDPEVQQVEQERITGRERGHHQDRRESERLQPFQHVRWSSWRG